MMLLNVVAWFLYNILYTHALKLFYFYTHTLKLFYYLLSEGTGSIPVMDSESFSE